jgi:hypothetical protein
MARTTVIWFLFTGMISNPVVAHVQVRVIEIVLRRGVFIPSDYETFLVDKSGFPIITTYHVADIVPSVSFWRARDLCKRVIRWLAIDDLV